MKKHFLFLGLLAMASVITTSCSDDDNDSEPITNSNQIEDNTVVRPKGDGTESSPFLISTAGELSYFASTVNGDNASIPQNKSAHAKLIADIDLSRTCNGDLGSWTPIGNDTTYFSGVFDGGNHTINNIYIEGSSTQGQGLFGRIQNAEIKNLTIGSGVIVSNAIGTGAIVGVGTGTITNCHNFAYVECSRKFTGGIVGYLGENSIIEHCHNEGEIRGTNIDRSEHGVGGITGAASKNSTVKDCYNIGSVIGTSARVGGIVGSAEDCHITTCYSYGEARCLSNYQGGGICTIDCHFPLTIVENCFFYNAHDQFGDEAEMSRSIADFNNGTVFEALNELSPSVWKQEKDKYPVFKD